MTRIVDAALLVFVFVLPLSTAASEIALGVTVLAWLAGRPWSRPLPPGLRALAFATLGLAASWLLASAFSPEPVASLVNARKLYSIGLVFLVADRARDAVLARRIVTTAIAAGALSAAIGLVGFAVQRLTDTTPGYRLEGVFSTAMTSGNVLGILALVTLGALLVTPLRSRRGLGLVAAGGAQGAALVASLTRSSWLAFAAGAALLLGLRRARWLGVLTVLAGLTFLLGPQELRDRVGSIFDPTYETNQGRISLWKSGWVAFGERPWFGHGLQDFLALIARHRRPDATFVAGHFHNNVVQLAVSTGLVGLSAWLAWMVLAAGLLLRAVRAQRSLHAPVGLAVWLAFQVQGLFDFTFGDLEVVNQLYVWIGLGLAAAPSLPAGHSPGDEAAQEG